MKTKKKSIIESAMINYHDHVRDGKPWSGMFKLNIDGFEIGDNVGFSATIDEAVVKLKERMAEAISKFEKAEQ